MVERRKPFYEKLRKQEPVQYLVIGDSIGEGVGASASSAAWTSLLNQILEKTYKTKVKAVKRTKGGSASFDGLVEFNSYQTSKPYDAMFVSFGRNDQNIYTAGEFVFAYTALVENIRIRFPKAELFLFIENGLKKEYQAIVSQVAKTYGCVTIDAAQAFTSSDKNKHPLTADGIHPNDAGYQLYANEVWKQIQWRVRDPWSASLPKTFIEKLNQTHLHGVPSASKRFINKEKYFVSDKQGSSLEFTIKSQDQDFIGISMISNKDGGSVDVYIDGECRTSLSTYSPVRKRKHMLIDSSVRAGTHNVQFILNGRKSKRSIGFVVRIVGVRTKGMDIK